MKKCDLSATSVLLVDDSRHFRSIMCAILRGFGVRAIHESDDAAKAFDRFRERAFDVIILDLKMPGVDGFEFVDKVRGGADSPNPNVPIIVVSSDARRATVTSAIERGVDDFLVKPVRPVDVYRRLTGVLERPRKQFVI